MGGQQYWNFDALNCFGSFVRASGRCFFDLSGFEAADADIDTPNRSIGEQNLHPLEVWEEAAPRDTGDFLTDTAGFFGKTASRDRMTDQWFLLADNTCSHSPNTFQFQLVEIGAIQATV